MEAAKLQASIIALEGSADKEVTQPASRTTATGSSTLATEGLLVLAALAALTIVAVMVVRAHRINAAKLPSTTPAAADAVFQAAEPTACL